MDWRNPSEIEALWDQAIRKVGGADALARRLGLKDRSGVDTSRSRGVVPHKHRPVLLAIIKEPTREEVSFAVEVVRALEGSLAPLAQLPEILSALREIADQGSRTEKLVKGLTAEAGRLRQRRQGA